MFGSMGGGGLDSDEVSIGFYSFYQPHLVTFYKQISVGVVEF